MSMASDADSINLVMPIITWPDACSPLRVDWKSPITHRKAVWKLARFFRREFGYDFTQYGYGGKDDDVDHVAYLWCPLDCMLVGWRTHCIGATCFRKREETGKMAMQWIWLHPFFRRQGLLSAAWPRFVKEHGEFDVEGPLSEAMEAFLREWSNDPGI